MVKPPNLADNVAASIRQKVSAQSIESIPSACNAQPVCMFASILATYVPVCLSKDDP